MLKGLSPREPWGYSIDISLVSLCSSLYGLLPSVAFHLKLSLYARLTLWQVFIQPLVSGLDELAWY